MYNNNLTELLKTFTPGEIKEFREFLNCSYYNKRIAVNKLYELISIFYPGFDNDLLNKEKIFEKLFPGKKYNDSSLRVLNHYLTELAEKFLVHKRIEENKIEYTLQLSDILFEKEQNKLLEKNLRRSSGYLDSININAEDYHFYKFRLQSQNTYFRFASNYGNYDKIIAKTDWNDVFIDLREYYLLKSIVMYLNVINQKNLYKKEFETGSFSQLIENIKPVDYENSPVIKLYYYLIKLKTDKDHEDYYFKLKNMILRTKKNLNDFDLIGAYVQMGSYCTLRISEGEGKFKRELFELYKQEIEEKTYLMSDNTMSPLFFRNAVVSGLAMKEYEWTNNFIHKYRPELNKKSGDNYFYYCLAKYEFEMENFESSIELLSRIRFDEIYMKLNSKILYMQNLYELHHFDNLLHSLESFRHFLGSDKLIPEERKKSCLHFHNHLKKLITLKARSLKTELALLKRNISNDKILKNKDWLLEKIDPVQ
ncbi:MAG TPA: hypothetical protein PKA90_16340 [Ignavibacteria bacterium]|nr:hypothetical protein [Ignavibacteria bacterium]HMR41987.1 hypothetical protein [Ignavibacteria bacterium]